MLGFLCEGWFQFCSLARTQLAKLVIDILCCLFPLKDQEIEGYYSALNFNIILRNILFERLLYNFDNIFLGVKILYSEHPKIDSLISFMLFSCIKVFSFLVLHMTDWRFICPS